MKLQSFVILTLCALLVAAAMVHGRRTKRLQQAALLSPDREPPEHDALWFVVSFGGFWGLMAAPRFSWADSGPWWQVSFIAALGLAVVYLLARLVYGHLNRPPLHG